MEVFLMGATRVPVDVTIEHFMAGKTILQHVLHDIELTIGYGPKWLTCRLNQSDTTEPTAFFLGWVENAALRKIRVAANQPDPGLFRFMDPVHGATYENALKKPTEVLKQNWRKPTDSTSPLAPLRLYQKAGHYGITKNNEISRLSVAIKVNERYVGTLNTGLSVDPGTKLDDKMMQWAQSANSELVQYLRNEFLVGGPFANAAVSARGVKRKVRKSA
jgi:hypothetical protein